MHGAMLGWDSRSTDNSGDQFPTALHLIICLKLIPLRFLERSEVKINLELRLN